MHMKKAVQRNGALAPLVVAAASLGKTVIASLQQWPKVLRPSTVVHYALDDLMPNRSHDHGPSDWVSHVLIVSQAYSHLYLQLSTWGPGHSGQMMVLTWTGEQNQAVLYVQFSICFQSIICQCQVGTQKRGKHED